MSQGKLPHSHLHVPVAHLQVIAQSPILFSAMFNNFTSISIHLDSPTFIPLSKSFEPPKLVTGILAISLSKPLNPASLILRIETTNISSSNCELGGYRESVKQECTALWQRNTGDLIKTNKSYGKRDSKKWSQGLHLVPFCISLKTQDPTFSSFLCSNRTYIYAILKGERFRYADACEVFLGEAVWRPMDHALDFGPISNVKSIVERGELQSWSVARPSKFQLWEVHELISPVTGFKQSIKFKCARGESEGQLLRFIVDCANNDVDFEGFRITHKVDVFVGQDSHTIPLRVVGKIDAD